MGKPVTIDKDSLVVLMMAAESDKERIESWLDEGGFRESEKEDMIESKLEIEQAIEQAREAIGAKDD